MLRLLGTTLVFFAVNIIYAQFLTVEATLTSSINESSGLVWVNGRLITHNDSSNDAQLFEINEADGSIERIVTIQNAANVDWEDVATDGTYIYIADIGNYTGDRTDLKVYRVSISDYMIQSEVNAEVISFNYSDQTSFPGVPFNTNFDAEGLIHYNNTLYIFTKNWLDGNTNVYELPKTPGNYSINKIDTIEAQGLISGATMSTASNSVLLSGYDLNGAFVIHLSDFSNGLFSNGSFDKINLEIPIGFSEQIEGITSYETDAYYLSSEEQNGNIAALYTFNTNTLTTEHNDVESLTFYPNPAYDAIYINVPNTRVEIFDVLGQLVLSSKSKKVSLSQLKAGVYLIRLSDKNRTISKRLLVKNSE